MQKTKGSFQSKKSLLGLLLAVALFLVLIPVIVLQTAPAAEAADPINVGDQTGLVNAIAAAPAGQLQVINVTQSFSVGSTVTIPANKNIRLNLPSSVRILKDDDSTIGVSNGRTWILNYGTEQNSPVLLVSQNAMLTIDGGGEIRTQGYQSGRKEVTEYMSRTGITNFGVLTVLNARITAGVEDGRDYMIDREGDINGNTASVMTCAVAIRNEDSGTVNFQNGTLWAHSGSFSWTANSRGFAMAISVGILNDKGGTVNMTGGNIDVYSRTGSGRTYFGASTNGKNDCHAWGIASGSVGKTTVSGGKIVAENFARGDFDGATEGSDATYHGSSVGVGYTGANYPVIAGSEIETKSSGAWKNGGGYYKTQAAIGPTPTGIEQTTNNSGIFLEDGGNQIATSGSTTLAGGMLPGKVKVAVYYRFWDNTSKTGTPQVFPGRDAGLAAMLSDKSGTSYLKLGNLSVQNPNPGTGSVAAQPYPYDASSTVNKGYANPGTWVGYNAGAVPYNTDYFFVHSLSYDLIPNATAADHMKSTHAVIAEFNRSNNYTPETNLYRNWGTQALDGNKLYIYVDYVKQDTHELRASLSSDPKAQLSTWTMSYQNRAAIAGSGSGFYDIPLYIFNTYGVPYNSTDPNAKTHKNITDAYNLNASQAQGHKTVTYKYKLSTQGDDAYVDGLPTNANAAGQEYRVRAYIPSDTAYSRNAKNVAAPASGYFEFALKIERATIGLTPNDPFVQKPVYGTRLSGIAVASEVQLQESFRHVDGSFSWDAGSNVVPNVVTGSNPYYVTNVTFTPSAAFIGNYAPRTFAVKIQVLPKALRIYAGTESARNINATYGDWPRYTAYFEGLAANDLQADGKTPKAEISADLDYKVLVNSQYVNYASISSGGAYSYPLLDAGDYPCAISGFDNANYTVTYENGNLQIGKRTITVTAVAPEKKYFDGTFDVEVELKDPRGNTSWHTVGYTNDYNIIIPRTVVGLMADYQVSGGKPVAISLTAMPTLSGTQASNYNIAVDGMDTLATIIVKARVNYVLPTFSADPNFKFTYDSTQKLSNTTGTPFKLPEVRNVAGHTNGYWAWDASILGTAPSVGNAGYKAWFIPDDSANFDPVEETIIIPVRKKQVQVTIVLRNPGQDTYYGDNVPGFAFQFIGFTGTDKETTVPMTGNYTMSCSYQKGNNAGTYPINVTLNNLVSTNYEYVDLDTSLIVKKRPVYITPQSLTKEYGYVLNESDFVAQVENMVDGDSRSLLGTISFTTDYHHESLATRNVKDGGYVVRVSASGTPVNYEIVPRTGTLTITKAELKFTAGNYIGLEFNAPTPNLANTYTVTGYKFNETPAQAFTGTPLISTTYVQGNPVDTYDITIQRNNLSSVNYTITIEQRNGYLSVVPATPVVSTWPTASVVYSNSLADAVINTSGAHSSVDGTYAFDRQDYYPDYYTDNNNPSAKFKLIFYPSNANFKSIDTNITITVLQKDIEGSVGISGSPMKGETLTVDLGGVNPSSADAYQISWRYSDQPEIVVGTGVSYAIQDFDLGKLLFVELAATGPYSGTLNSSPTSRIIDAASLQDTTLSLFNVDFDFNAAHQYDSRSITVGITKKSEFSSTMGGTLTVKYNNSTIAPRDAGTYRVTLDISAGSHYKPINGLFVGEFTIDKAPLAVYYSPANKVYDGTTKAVTEILTFDSPIGTDDVTVNAENATYAFESIDASNQQIHVRVKGASLKGHHAHNYYIDDSRNLARIEKRPIQVVATPVARAYDPSNYYVAVNFSPNFTGVLSVDRDYVAIGAGVGRLPSNDNNAGYRAVLEVTADVIGTIYGDKSHNYKIAVSNLSGLTVEIEKATPNYGALPVIDPVTYDYDRPLSSIRISKVSNNWSWINATVVPQVMNEGYPARYTPGQSQLNNYKIVDLVLPLTVNPKQVTMHATVLDSVKYGDPVPRVTISYTGISTNEDENEVIKGGPPTFTTDYYQYAPAGGDYSIFVDENSVFADNYTFKYNSGSPAKIVVSPVSLSVSASAAQRSYIPNDTSIQVAFGQLTGVLRNDDVKLGNAVINGNVEDASVGQNKRVYFNAPAVVGAHAGNYELVVTNQNTLLVNITKAVPTGYVFPSSATVEFGNTLAYARFTGSSTGELGGYFYFEQRDQKLDIGIYPDYVVVYQPGDISNYDFVRQTVHLEVSRSVKTFNLSLTGTLYVGETLHAVVSGLDTEAASYAVYSWYRVNPQGGDPVLLSNETQYILTDADNGYNIMVKVELLSPYSGARSIESSRTVAEESLTFWQKLAKWFQSIISAIQGLFGMMG